MAPVRRSLIVLTAVVVLVVHEANAQATAEVSVAVQLRNVAGVPDATIQDATRRVMDIFRQARIQLEAPSALAGEPEPALLILLTDKRPASRKVFESRVLGLAAEGAQGRGRVAYVFYDRVRAYARAQSLPASLVLAFVIAHELGHLLLPAPAHAEAGIMKESWTRVDIAAAKTDALGFLPEQADAMREYLRSIAVPDIAGELSY